MREIDVSTMPRKEWLELRRNGLGGSDAAGWCGNAMDPEDETFFDGLSEEEQAEYRTRERGGNGNGHHEHQN